MMTHEQIEMNKKMISELKSNFDKLLEVNSSLVASIPAENMPNKSMIQADLSKIKKLVAKGDLATLNKLAKKYGNHDI